MHKWVWNQVHALVPFGKAVGPLCCIQTYLCCLCSQVIKQTYQSKETEPKWYRVVYLGDSYGWKLKERTPSSHFKTQRFLKIDSFYQSKNSTMIIKCVKNRGFDTDSFDKPLISFRFSTNSVRYSLKRPWWPCMVQIELRMMQGPVNE